MDINSNNLVNMSMINNTKKFDNIKTDKLEEEQLKKVSDEFEAFFLKQIMDISLKSTKVAGEGAGSDIIKGMYTQAVSDNSTGSLGISNMLYEFLSRNNKQG
ncbi:hypothetical protein [Arcobacter roscoffensis]|uniref:Flagellar protein FlgJ N-terminal domain-containing protein n=1 Tax=Arcobacter roscoffensis TaxID=2961520 RepID=A0ABY5E193_9BACT|nr:hypothetical protein [Arcobacter roscoffensis]UTJ05974.1 hypothetical protein NJU99_12045 [Arcobacter roscoffensis]